MPLRKRLLLIAVVVVGSVGCDQATKKAAEVTLRAAGPTSLAGDLIRLHYTTNEGAFLSAGSRLPAAVRFWLLTVGVAAVLSGMLGYSIVSRRLSRQTLLGMALVVGGGASNWIDRVLNQGRVIDFMNLGIGPVRTGIFNAADLAIVAGVALLALRRSAERDPVQTDPPPPPGG